MKANKVPAVLGETGELVAKLSEMLLKPDEDQVERQSFTVDDVLCIFDASPKLPSVTVVNHICLAKAKKVLLIREKLSRLSSKLSLDASIGLLLDHEDHETKFTWDVKATKKVELKALMDPSSLAE